MSRPHLIADGDHQVIHVAHRRGVDVDQNLIRCRVLFGSFGEGWGFDTLEGVAKNCAHFTLRDLSQKQWNL